MRSCIALDQLRSSDRNVVCPLLPLADGQLDLCVERGGAQQRVQVAALVESGDYGDSLHISWCPLSNDEATCKASRNSNFVMAGLVPAIHVLLTARLLRRGCAGLRPRMTNCFGGARSRRRRSSLFLAFAAFEQRGVVFVDFDEVDEVLDSEVGEGHHAVVADAIDPYHAVFDIHFVGDIGEPALVFSEVLGDPVDGRDVVDLVDMHYRPA